MVLWTALLCCLVLCSSWGESQLTTVKQWKLLTYNFESNAPVNDKNFFNPEKVVATGMIIGQDRIFIATPRLYAGVPATMNTIPSSQLGGDSPALEPYPNWSFHGKTKENYNCSDPGLVSVYHSRFDACNRLWVLDAAVSRSFEDYEITCPPKILIFDLVTNEVVRRIDFVPNVLKPNSLFTNFIIDESNSKPENNCNDAFVYISDTAAAGIVVYDNARNLSWRVTHPEMFPNPEFSESRINEDKFVLMDGILGLGFDSKARLLYFQHFASYNLYSVSTDVLRAGPFPAGQTLPVRVVGRKSSQGLPAAVLNDEGTILFSPFTSTAVATWNPTTNEQKVLAYDPEALQFVAESFIPENNKSGIFILSTRFHKYFLNKIDPNAFNVRILRIDGPGYTPTEQLFFPASYTSASDASSQQISQTQTSSYPYPYNTEYLRGVGQSFQYEAPGYSNKGQLNPFTSATFGKQISYVDPSIPYPTFGQSPYGNDFINLQYRKRAKKAAH